MKHVAWEPCPACQEPVHPVAGRCKHCRADLVALRADALAARKRAAAEARAAAATPLRVTSMERRAPTAAPPASPGGASTRKLLLAASAVLLLGVAGGVVAQQVLARGPSKAPAPVRHANVAPGDAPAADPRPGPSPFDFGAPPAARDPFQHAPFDPSSPGGGGLLNPFDLFQQMVPGLTVPSPGRLPPRAPGSPLPDVDDVQLFLPAMVDVVCDKLAQCGLFDGAAGGMCKMMAMGLQDEETVDRVRRGQCSYDAASARQCLEAVGGMTCDNNLDPLQILTLTDRIAACGRTLDCP